VLAIVLSCTSGAMAADLVDGHSAGADGASRQILRLIPALDEALLVVGWRVDAVERHAVHLNGRIVNDAALTIGDDCDVLANFHGGYCGAVASTITGDRAAASLSEIACSAACSSARACVSLGIDGGRHRFLQSGDDEVGEDSGDSGQPDGAQRCGDELDHG
jgi:hypothetical protein